MSSETVVKTEQAVFRISADRDFWPTVVDALSEVKALVSKEPCARVRGEDGVVSAILVASLLEDAVKRDPTRKLRPLGWNSWPTK